MDRALVVVDDTDPHRELVTEAVGLARGADAEIVMFSWITDEELEKGLDAVEAVEKAENAKFGDTSAEDFVGNTIRKVTTDVFSEPLDYELAWAVTDEDDLADEILSTARENDCDHVFLVGRRRSPTGKVLFGDVAQQVLLNFEDFVTVKME